MNKRILHYLPLAIILILMIYAFGTHIYYKLSFTTLKEKHDALQLYVDQNPVNASLIFIGIYILSMSLSIPDAFFLSILGGYLFSFPLGFIYVVISECVGATIFFLAARYAFGGWVSRQKYPTLQKMKSELDQSPASYLLFIRFVHVFPLWLVNIAAAVFHVQAWTFMWTTAVGFIPSAFIYTQAGMGISEIFQHNEKFEFNDILNTKLKIALGALAFLSLMPILYKKIFMKKKKKPG